MPWRNSEERYGLVAIILHWLVAITLIGMFILGLWMTSLTLYDRWYVTAPYIHKSIGLLLFTVMIVRLAWRLLNPRPAPLPTHTRFEHVSARLMHAMLYLLLFAVMVAGYLMTTADGHAIDAFGLFSIPATLTSIPHQEDVMGEIHEVLAITLMVLVGVHAAAALKHHFYDRDNTLRRMWGR